MKIAFVLISSISLSYGITYDDLYSPIDVKSEECSTYFKKQSSLNGQRNSLNHDKYYYLFKEFYSNYSNYLNNINNPVFEDNIKFIKDLSLSKDENQNFVLGLFQTKKSNCIPYCYNRIARNFHIHNVLDIHSVTKNNEKINTLDLNAELYSCLNLSIVDLEMTSMNIADLKRLHRIKTIKKLGLTACGIEFSEPFIFPEKLESLIVRRAVLNNHFFDAINQCEYLKEISIVDCNMNASNYPKFVLADFSFIDRERTKRQGDTPFRNVSKYLNNIEIVRSNPIIFDYMIVEKWHSLSEMKADIYSNETSFISLIIPSDVDGEHSFPNIENAVIRIHHSKKDRYNEYIKDHYKYNKNIIDKIKIEIIDHN
jgi:hypothetical protein